MTLKRKLTLVAVLGLATGVLAAALIFTSNFATERGALAAFLLVIGWSFIGTGLFAWWRRPGNPIGWLMTLVGFTIFLPALSSVDIGWVFMVGQAFGVISYGLIIHMLLAFPDGRLHSRFERVVAAAVYFDVTVMQVADGLFYDPGQYADGCTGCPSNPFLIDANKAAEGAINGVQTVIAVAAIVGLCVALWRRWRPVPAAQRRALTPVLIAGGGAMTIVVVGLIASMTNAPDGVTEGILLATLVAFAFIPFAFLAGIMRSRLSRASALSALVARLGSPEHRREAMRDALAEATGDDALRVAYWVNDGWVDGEGHQVDLEPLGDQIAVFWTRDGWVDGDGRQIRSGMPVGPAAGAGPGEPIAAVIHDRSLIEERDLVRDVGSAVGIALENELLEAELRANVEELRASRARIVEAGYEERRRVERDLHDGAQQRLMALGINLQLAKAKVADEPDTAAGLLDDAIDVLAEATAELREFARGIHPAVLSDKGLDAAIAGLASRAPIPVEVSGTPEARLPTPVESTAYFVVAEALTNVARYSRAEGASVRVEQVNGAVEIEIADDGVGGADPTAGSGLSGLADRVSALGGEFRVDSPAGAGTKILVRVPCG